MLNAKFLINILRSDELLANKLSIAKKGRAKRVWNICIIDDLIYNDYNLNGFDFDFLDLKHSLFNDFSTEELVSIREYHTKNRQSLLKKRRLMNQNQNKNRNRNHLFLAKNKNNLRAFYSMQILCEFN
jgi:hypothetical protein